MPSSLSRVLLRTGSQTISIWTSRKKTGRERDDGVVSCSLRASTSDGKITAGVGPSPPLEREPVVAHHPGVVGTLRSAAQPLSSETAPVRSDFEQSQGQ